MANPVRQEIVLRLCESPATQKQLAADLELNSGSLSKQMRKLEAAGIVHRHRSHAPYEIRFKESVLRVLQTTAQLNEEIAEERRTAAIMRRKRVNRVVIRGVDDAERETL